MTTTEPVTREHLLTLMDHADQVMHPEEAALLRAGIEQPYAGEEPYIHEGTCASPAQWIWLWNRATPDKRLAVAECVERDAATARACFMGGHVERLTELQNAWHEGPGRAQAAVSMVLALAYELDEGPPDISAPDISTRLRTVIEEAMNGPAPILVPTTTTAPPALLATTRLPAHDEAAKTAH